MKIAIFCPNWVGDMVMATPALRALRTQYPDAELVAILRPYVADVLTGLNLVDRMLLHAPRSRTNGQGGSSGWEFARQLRNQRFDKAILLTNSFRSGWWAFISGARQRIGFARNGRSWFLTDPVRPRSFETPNPVIDAYLRLAKHAGCERVTRQMELATTPDDEQRLHSFWWKQHATDVGPGYVCLNPGGAFGASKHWPTTSFAELAQQIVWQFRKRVLVVCGPSERQEARQIVALAGHRAIVSLANEEPSIGLTKAAIKHADLLITTDSGPRHFAPPFGVPVVTLFGPTHTAWSETFYEKSLHLQLDMDCGPCQQRKCPLAHHRCMRDLTPDWVLKAAASMLKKYPARTDAA